MFQIENATFAVPERTLLHGITVSFDTNKVYGLIGHNGSGKSTLLKLLTRQHRPVSGRILLDGRDIADYSARSYARQTAYLPQYLPAATALKAEELVAMGRYAWSGLLGRSSEADRQAVAEAFRLTHTERFTGQIVDTLSGGERSRIWLAMCLAQQSRYLLLDEPLANLDPPHQADWMALMRRHVAAGGAVISVLHELGMALQADDLLLMRAGSVFHCGPVQEDATRRALQAVFDDRIAIHPLPPAADGRPQWAAIAV